MDVGAFRGLIMSSMDAQAERERTPAGRRKLIAEYRAEAKRIRRVVPPEGWPASYYEPDPMDAHIAPTAELIRRDNERADWLEKRADEISNMRGIVEPWAAYLP
jgi:hypothetical protein